MCFDVSQDKSGEVTERCISIASAISQRQKWVAVFLGREWWRKRSDMPFVDV
jgi:hypothetical protein